MTVIRCSADTPLPEDRVLVALTDFSTRHPGPMAHLDPSLYQVHGSGADWADV